MRSGPRALLVAASLALLAAGCGSCKRAPSASEPADAGAGGPMLPAVPFEPKAPWPVVKLPGAGETALPSGCRLVLPVGLVRTETAGLGFVAARGAPGALAFAVQDLDASRAHAAALRGIVELAFGSKPRAARDVPWWTAAAPPPLAAADGKWLALIEQPIDDQLSRVVLWREGQAPEELGRGDQLSPVDLRCVDRVCAALTTRLARVAGVGASLFVGAPEAPASTWRRHDLGGIDGGAEPRPATIAGVHGDAIDVAMLDRDGVTILRVQGDRVSDGPHLRGHYGLLDVVTLGASSADPIAALAVSHGDPVDADGCAGAGARLTIERAGHEPAIVRTSAPPLSAFLRPVGDGAILVWIAPVNCRDRERPIVHAMLLDATGAPASSDTAVDDASGFAIEARGDEIELFVRTAAGIKWIRGVCGADVDR